MSLISNVSRRGATYYVRVGVPVDLQRHLKTKTGAPMMEKWVSLRTKDPTEAKRRARGALSLIDAEFEAKRAEVKAAEVSDAELQDIAHSAFRSELDLHKALLKKPPTDADLNVIWRELEKTHGPESLEAWRLMELVERAVKHAKEYRAERIAELEADLATYAGGGARQSVAEAIAERGLVVEPGSETEQDITHYVLRGELAGLKATVARDAGDWSDAVTDKMVAVAPAAIARRGETVMEMFEAYAQENPRGITSDTIDQSRMAVRLFASSLPPRSSVRAITRVACAEWKRLLMAYPVKAAETSDFKGKSMREIVELNKIVGKPVITGRTVNRYLSSLGAFCDWLLVRADLEASPISRMQVTVKKKPGKPFPIADLPKIFASPLFTGAESAESIRRPGTYRIRDHRYWIPLVMLYSGARPGELAQLLVEDVRISHARWIMHITTENDDEKTLKTEGSHRVVPVHPDLERLGFLDYVNELRQAGERRVFPSAQRNRRQWVPDLSREFSRLLADIGVKTDTGPSSKLSLYSFRHTVSDALRRAGFDDLEFAPIYGHGKATTTGKYGIEKPRTIQQRSMMIDAIAYPGLDLSHLRPSA